MLIVQDVNIDIVMNREYIICDWSLFGDDCTLDEIEWDIQSGITLTPAVFPQY
jgi:hypothetical protein